MLSIIVGIIKLIINIIAIIAITYIVNIAIALDFLFINLFFVFEYTLLHGWYLFFFLQRYGFFECGRVLLHFFLSARKKRSKERTPASFLAG